MFPMKRLDLSFVFMLALLVTAAGLSVAAGYGQKVPPRKDFALFPSQIGEWKGERLPDLDADTLQTLGVTDYLNRSYRRGGQEVTLYVGYYRSQRAGESIHSPKHCLPGAGYEVLDSRFGHVEIPAFHRTIPVNHYRLQRDQERLFVLYWYETNGHVMASEYTSKAMLVWQAMRTGHTDGALVRVIASGSDQEAVAAEFARQVFPVLREYLGG